MGIKKRSTRPRRANNETQNRDKKLDVLTALGAAFEKAGWQKPNTNEEPKSSNVSPRGKASPINEPTPFRTKSTGKRAPKKRQIPPQPKKKLSRPVQRKRTEAERAAEAKILGSTLSKPTRSPSSNAQHLASFEELRCRTKDFVFEELCALEKEDSRLADLLEADASERAALSSRIEAGRRHDEQSSDQENLVYVSLGIDFGTTSTKVVARQLYTDGEPAMAAPVPAFAQADKNPHLWATRLWFDTHGHLTLTPEPKSVLIPSLKTSLLDNPTAENEAQAAAFLALIIAHTRGWVRGRKEIVQRGAINWSYNFGFPAASLDDKSLAECYERVIAAALQLADCDGFIDSSAAHTALGTVCSKSILDTFEATLQPEVAAAAAAIKGPNRIPHGLFVMIDVGGSTVDCCAFRLNDDDGLTKMPIMQAAVELYGVLPSRICVREEKYKDDFSYLLFRQLNSIIFKLRQENSRLSQAWAEGLPIFFVGGGTKSALHIQEVERLSPWLRNWLGGDTSGTYIYSDLSLGDLTHGSSTTELHRLTVAAGLSYAEDQIPQVRLPDSIQPNPPPSKRNWEDSYVGPEQM